MHVSVAARCRSQFPYSGDVKGSHRLGEHYRPRSPSTELILYRSPFSFSCSLRSTRPEKGPSHSPTLPRLVRKPSDPVATSHECLWIGLPACSTRTRNGLGCRYLLLLVVCPVSHLPVTACCLRRDWRFLLLRRTQCRKFYGTRSDNRYRSDNYARSLCS